MTERRTEPMLRRLGAEVRHGVLVRVEVLTAILFFMASSAWAAETGILGFSFKADTMALLVVVASAMGAFFKSWTNGKQLQQIHVLVNSRLTSALKEINRLQIEVAKLTGSPPPPAYVEGVEYTEPQFSGAKPMPPSPVK